MNMQKSFLSLCWRSPKHHMHHSQHWMTIFEIVPSLHGPLFIAEGCDHPTGNVYSEVASGGSYDMELAANLPFWAIQFFNIYLSPVQGSDHLRTRTWPFWTEPDRTEPYHPYPSLLPNKSKITKSIVNIIFVFKVNLLDYLCSNKLNQVNKTVSLAILKSCCSGQKYNCRFYTVEAFLTKQTRHVHNSFIEKLVKSIACHRVTLWVCNHG